MRKLYIDNLRWIAILLLFPFHAAQIWSNPEDGGFYIWTYTETFAHVFSNIVFPWFMTLLFAISGMSSRYALKKRTPAQLVKERTKKLLIPFVFGTLFLCPVMTYIAEVYNCYSGTYIEQYRLFFTKETDLTGYHGGFTPGHYWFLLYLYIISLFGLIAVLVQRKNQGKCPALSYPVIVMLFVIPWICSYILDIGGKSLGQYLSLYLIGYFLLSDDVILTMLKKYSYVSLSLCILSGTAYIYLYCFAGIKSIFISIIYHFYSWTGIITLLGIAQKCLDMTNKTFAYLSKASYSIYILHMPILVVTGYFVLKLEIGFAGQFLLITFVSAVLTFAVYELVKRIPVLRFFLGIPAPKKT